MALKFDSRVNVGDVVNIIQHPLGGPKKFSQHKVLGHTSPVIQYGADTEEASSGSPVIFQDEVVALHKGFFKNANVGILISEIWADLNKKYGEYFIKVIL